MTADVTRRLALALMAGAGLAPGSALADEVIDLEWEDLLPEGTETIPSALRGLIDHDESALAASQPA